MQALVTKQGTAMAEAALCDPCFKHPVDQNRLAVVLEVSKVPKDWDPDAGWQDATGNETLACVVCGAEE